MAKIKTTVEFSDAASTELTRLSKELEETKADVIRNALALYGFVVTELEKSNKRDLAIINTDTAIIKKVILIPGMLRKR